VLDRVSRYSSLCHDYDDYDDYDDNTTVQDEASQLPTHSTLTTFYPTIYYPTIYILSDYVLSDYVLSAMACVVCGVWCVLVLCAMCYPTIRLSGYMHTIRLCTIRLCTIRLCANQLRA
jgi:hypothetical protein